MVEGEGEKGAMYGKGRKEKDGKVISNLLFLNQKDKKRELEELRI